MSSADATFFYSYTVRFGETDRRLRATPMAMYEYLQEAAISHSETAGLGAADLARRNMAWVLNRVHVRFEDYPMWRDELSVETWVCSVEGMYATRDFVMRDKSGAELCVGTSRWVLIDTAKQRPVRVPEEVARAYGHHDRRAVADGFPRHKAVEHAEASREFHVRLSDLDPNDHANSACYFDWCVEAVPLSIHRNHRLESLEISYKAEAVLADSIHSQGQCIHRTETNCTYIHTIHNLTRKSVAALGQSHWVRTDD